MTKSGLVSRSLVVLLALASEVSAKKTSLASDLKPSYDYIVVGGGTAGLTIANRLSEDEEKTVLVIEAGPIPPLSKEAVVPWFGSTGATRTLHTWNMSTVPQPGLDNREIPSNQVKVLGGDSVVNGMVFDRALPADVDAFQALGISGWGWDDILPYFKKLETFSPPPPDKVDKFGVTFDEKCHGYLGPVGVGWNSYVFPHDDAFLQALDSMGVPRAHEPACNKLGSFLMPFTVSQNNQSRIDARNAYLDPASGRSNLDILYANQATKVLTELRDGQVTASAVEFARDSDDTRKTVSATKEVIVSAGTLRSPHLLMLSGIGRGITLGQHNITPVAEVPGVGYNLQDHYTAAVFYNVKRGVETLDDETNSTFMEEQERLYFQNRTGRWTRGYASAFAYLPPSTLDKVSSQQPFYQQYNETFDEATILNDTPQTVAAGYRKQWAILRNSFRADDIAAWELAIVGGKATTSTNLHPFSRGNVTLASSNPFDPPAVDPRFLSHPADFENLAQGISILRKIASTEAMRENLLLGEMLPGANVTAPSALRKWVSTESGGATGNHYVGSCAMLPLAYGGVVDAHLKVYGVRRLRVVDASVLTMVPSAHTQATVYALSEKAADMIKSDYSA